MVRKRQEHGAHIEKTPLTSPVLKLHPNESVSLYFFVENNPYLLMLTRTYELLGIYCCRGRGKIETSTAVKHYLDLFGARGIAITSIHGDNEFTKITEAVRPIHVKLAARGEHVGDIKRKIRVVKERTRCNTNALANIYKQFPRVMINENLKDKVHWLNAFPPKDYIHPNTGPAGLILGNGKSDYNNLKLDFG